MVAQISNLGIHDTTPGSNAPNQYGPIAVGAGFTITKITLRGGISFAGVHNSGLIVFINFLQHGFQHGASGYTPTSPESVTLAGTEWLAFQGITPTQGALSYADPPTASGFSERYAVELTWRGQFYTPNGTDVYYSVGRIYNASVAWNLHGNLDVQFG